MFLKIELKKKLPEYLYIKKCDRRDRPPGHTAIESRLVYLFCLLLLYCKQYTALRLGNTDSKCDKLAVDPLMTKITTLIIRSSYGAFISSCSTSHAVFSLQSDCYSSIMNAGTQRGAIKLYYSKQKN